MPGNQPDETVRVTSDDEEMLEAINEARGSMKSFLDAFFHPKDNQKSFLLKVAFEDDGRTEHIWLADLDMLSHPMSGVVANEPGLQNLEFMQRVDFAPEKVTDWMYLEDGFLIGGFTTKVLEKNRLSSTQKKRWSFPWKRNV